MNDHVAEPFRTILNGFAGPKPSLQSQTVLKRDTIRYAALHKGWQECGDLISFGTFVGAVNAYEAARDEAHLDAQYEAERAKDYRQAENDREWEQAVIEARERFANEGDR